MDIKKILSNHWVIGIGTAVIAGVVVGLILYFGFGIGKPAQETTNSQITDINPIDIEEYIQNLPLYQQESACENYLGLHVNWILELFLLTNIDNLSDVIVYARQPGYIYPDIEFNININDYPQLKHMSQGDQFNIEGTIDDVHSAGLHIKLTNIEISFQ